MEFIIFVVILVLVVMYVVKHNRGESLAGKSMAELSSEINYDIRDVLMAGYSERQINKVRRGKITIDELWREKPEGNKHNPNP